METLLRPAWAEINLDHLAHNIREVRRVTRRESQVCAVIKSDGYGHGAVAIAQTLLDNGADRLAVAILTEAIQLRKAYPKPDIMVLGYTPADQAQAIIDYGLIQTVYDLDVAKAYSDAAVACGAQIKVHIKIETGMGRIGMQPTSKGIEDIMEISLMPGILIEGIFTHFAAADEIDKSVTQEQFRKFEALTKLLESKGLRIQLKHASNSAGIIDLPDYDLDMVRPGIMLYGLYPSGTVSHEAVKLKEVMTLKARVSHVKELPPGTGISYGHKYHTRGIELIASLPIGYADGYSRMLTGKAHVLIQGRRVPVVGRICMDQCMINVTGLNVKVGDLVTLFGGEETDKIWIDDVADWLGTNTHEVICRIDKRIPRLYMKKGQVVQIRDYVQELV